LRALLVHNHYQQPGGEDHVFATEADLLESVGHQVERLTTHNDRIHGMSGLSLMRATLWSSSAFKEVRERVERFRPDVVHVHNSFPLLSPAVHHAAKRAGTAVVQTLHNYRLYCAAATFHRNDAICNRCGPKQIPWPSVVHACYRDSRLASAGVASMLVLHRALRTWSRHVDAYIALSHASKNKFVELGLPSDKLHVKYNVIHPDPGYEESKQDYGIFVGRLTRDKGVQTLLEALRQLSGRVPFHFVGAGPLENEVRRASERIPGVSYLGQRSQPEVLRLLGGARFLVIPSEWLEPFGRVVIEAFARGTPVLASNIGALRELVTHGRTGWHFEAGDASDLVRQIREIADRPETALEMVKHAREEYEAKHGIAANVARLEEIYARAIDVSRSSKA